MGPLEGVRILDLTRVLAGPWATQLLADLGATVFKIEKPGVGDDTRQWGPPYAQGESGAREATYFLCANRGKQSLAIDIAKPEGAALVRDLAARCDVLVENFKVGGLARYGLDYASLRAANPGLVYCSITGFGQTGPYATRPGYDVVVQAMGGMMSLTGEPDGEPMKTGVALVDIVTGLYAANAIQAALRHKDRTGKGQHIDMALLDVQVAALANQAAGFLATGDNPVRHGNAHPSIVPYQTLRTGDGWIMLAVGNDGQFRRLCEVLGQPALGTDPLYAASAGRVAHRVELIALLQTLLMPWSRADLLQALEAAGVPASPINTLDQVFADPQVVDRGLRIEMPHTGGGSTPGVAAPIRMSATPVGAALGPPTLGEHTRAALRDELGLTDADLAALAASGAI